MALWVPGRASDAPFATSHFFLVFQIFFIFPQTFLACSHAHIIDRFNIRIAMFVEPLTEPLPEQTKCVFNFSCFRESDPIVHLRSLFKPMDMAHILNKQFYSSEAKVLLINFNYGAESVVSHDLQAHNKLHCVTLWACRSAIYLVLKVWSTFTFDTLTILLLFGILSTFTQICFTSEWVLFKS